MVGKRQDHYSSVTCARERRLRVAFRSLILSIPTVQESRVGCAYYALQPIACATPFKSPPQPKLPSLRSDLTDFASEATMMRPSARMRLDDGFASMINAKSPNGGLRNAMLLSSLAPG